jgi:hypothetical protein
MYQQLRARRSDDALARAQREDGIGFPTLLPRQREDGIGFPTLLPRELECRGRPPAG